MTPGIPCAAGVHALGQPLAHRLTMYAAVGAENWCQGMATGAFGVLLLRITQKQFSATQYALFSSIFALGRTLAGPPAGYLVDAVGWTPFFLISTLASIPGLLLLARFVPLRAREPVIEEEKPVEARPVSGARLAATSLFVGAGGAAAACLSSALLAGLKAARGKPGASVDVGEQLTRLLSPSSPGDWLRLVGPAVVALLCAAAAAAYVAARHGVRARN